MSHTSSVLLTFLLLCTNHWCSCSLYPRDSESRQVKSLDGVWKLQVDDETILMSVPASYNDITTSKHVRDYVGVVWYERDFFVPLQWQSSTVGVRFGSVCYSATVYINGQEYFHHDIGHLPFDFTINDALKFGDRNVIQVAVNNTLSDTTIPQGGVVTKTIGNETYLYHDYSFDFFHFAGIDRPVLLYTHPSDIFINNIIINTQVVDTQGFIEYTVSVDGATDVQANIDLIDREGVIVLRASDLAGTLVVDDANLWWPYLMHPEPGYMYTLQVTVSNGETSDTYRQPIGIRSIKWNNTSVMINDKPIYMRGFGRHEDFAIKGKGLDLSVVLRDYNLLQWVGANSYRTSHYPYADEIMDLADQYGIMIIDECPAVNAEDFSAELLENHKSSLKQLIERDRNHPSVVMWSAANEPRSDRLNARDYFKAVVESIKEHDQTRPVTIAISASVIGDLSAQYLDVVGFNRYNAWYSDDGKTELIHSKVMEEAENWFKKHNKPVIMTEYGADTYPGLHTLPEYIWSEEYQVRTMTEHFKAFDELRAKGFFIGEMIWNFADFLTAQTYTRVGGNKKGIFTRDRQPKAVAQVVRQRYFTLANQLDGAELPDDLYNYVTSKNTLKDEL